MNIATFCVYHNQEPGWKLAEWNGYGYFYVLPVSHTEPTHNQKTNSQPNFHIHFCAHVHTYKEHHIHYKDTKQYQWEKVY